MAGDPDECRIHARRCAELAADAKTPQMRKTLTDLARSWAQLALQLEATEALVDHYRRGAGHADEPTLEPLEPPEPAVHP